MNIQKFYKLCLLIVLGTFFTLQLKADSNNTTTPLFKGGVWQTIVDGNPGEGGLFYRLKFEKDGYVEITKQCGGTNNIVEKKNWKQVDNKIIISSTSNASIKSFDGNSLNIVNYNTINYKQGSYEGVVKPYKHKIALIHWLLILLVLIALNEIFRRSKWATIAFFVILPIVLTYFVWSQQGVTYWFKWVKVYSVVFAVIWFTLIRYTKVGTYNWAKLIAALILAINIAEAVSQDFSMGYLPNKLNAIAGILNIITLFYGWKMIAPDNSKHKDMVWPGMTILWILSYDIWNIVYVYLNFPGSTSAQFMVILACTIPALFIKKGTWLQARGFTLAVWFMYYFTFPRFTEQMELMVPRNYNLMLTVAIVSIGINVVYFFVFVKKLRTKQV